jgi:hypothetical protein
MHVAKAARAYVNCPIRVTSHGQSGAVTETAVLLRRVLVQVFFLSFFLFCCSHSASKTCGWCWERQSSTRPTQLINNLREKLRKML